MNCRDRAGFLLLLLVFVNVAVESACGVLAAGSQKEAERDPMLDLENVAVPDFAVYVEAICPLYIIEMRLIETREEILISGASGGAELQRKSIRLACT
jgi:hypothetical protein